MSATEPRGIAVFDVGTTNTKLHLFDPEGRAVAVEHMASVHLPAPPYRAIDPEPVFAFASRALPALDAVLPVDVIVPSAHGSSLLLLDENNNQVLPLMDYQAEPPASIVEGYERIAPPFNEVFAPVIPAALTLGRQLFWQEQTFADAFARVRTIQPWGQYVAYRLGGRQVTEISALGAQSQLWDFAGHGYSSLARARGWARRFAPLANAWDVVGTLDETFAGERFRGRGEIRAGVHDSNANYLRYLAAGLGEFTLLSTGTWIIGFDTAADINALDIAHDTVANIDIFGRPVACCRFFGGKEFELVSQGAPGDAASSEDAARLIDEGIFALPSFTDTGGPVPGSGGKGRITGGEVTKPSARASLASLYCALMVSQSLDALGSRADIIVDGPFATNQVFLGILAALRAGNPGRGTGQSVLASTLSEGTLAGAMLIGKMDANGKLPTAAIDLHRCAPLPIPGLGDYQVRWRRLGGC